MKNGFILYTDYIEQVEMLEAEQVKTLFVAILRYASGMDLPEMDLPTRLVFSYFKTLNKKDRGKAGRKSIEYAKWRKRVFERDNYTCQMCGYRGSKLNAHHIMKYSEYPLYRCDVKNGVTLCEECHKWVHKNEK